MVTARPEASFALIDHTGRPVSQHDYRGRFLLVYFGFTHCKVVCPRSLAKLSAVIDQVGAEDQLVPLYITVDPERDTPERMQSYLTAYPHFTGLTGSREAIDSAKRAFRVFAERRSDPGDGQGYDVPHTAIAYLIGPDGAYRDHFADIVEGDEILRRVRNAFHEGIRQHD